MLTKRRIRTALLIIYKILDTDDIITKETAAEKAQEIYIAIKKTMKITLDKDAIYNTIMSYVCEKFSDVNKSLSYLLAGNLDKLKEGLYVTPGNLIPEDENDVLCVICDVSTLRDDYILIRVISGRFAGTIVKKYMKRAFLGKLSKMLGFNKNNRYETPYDLIGLELVASVKAYKDGRISLYNLQIPPNVRARNIREIKERKYDLQK